MNRPIELVKQWLADPESVTEEELKANSEAAAAAADRAEDAAYAARAEAAAAEATAYAAADAAVYWVKEYEELTDGE